MEDENQALELAKAAKDNCSSSRPGEAATEI